MPAQIIETNNTPINKIAIDPVTLRVNVFRNIGFVVPCAIGTL
jgi:hypothetical protein